MYRRKCNRRGTEWLGYSKPPFNSLSCSQPMLPYAQYTWVTNRSKSNSTCSTSVLCGPSTKSNVSNSMHFIASVY